MTKSRMIKKLTALLLVMIMVITAWPCAFASPEYVWANKSTGDLTVTFTKVTAEDEEYALQVRAQDKKKADVTVSKDVSLNNSSYYSSIVVSAYTEQNAEDTVTIQGGVTGKSDFGVGLDLYGSGKHTVTVNKNVKVTGTDSATGIRTTLNGYKSETVYDSNGYSGELNEAEYQGYNWVWDSESSMYKQVKIYYNQTEKYYYNDQKEKWSYKITPTGAAGNVTINGNVSAVASDGGATAVNMQNTGDATVIIKNNVSATGEIATGIDSENWTNDYTAKRLVSITGDLTVKATDGSATGIYQSGNQIGEVNVQGKVNVTGTTGATGISANPRGYYVEGKYNSETQKYDNIFYDLPGKATVTAAGDVKATATDGGAVGINASGTGQVEVKGVQNIEATGTNGASGIIAGNYYNNIDHPDGSKTVTATGNVIANGGTGSTYGLMVKGSGDVDLTVGGKVSTVSEGKKTIHDYGDGNSSTERGSDNGINSSSNLNKVNISIGNEVSVKTKENSAIGVMAYGTGESTVSVSGGVTVEGALSSGISATSAGYYTRYELNPETGYTENKFYETDGKTTITAARSVKATATDGSATGIIASGSGKTEVKGVTDVEATGTIRATGISASASGYYQDWKYNPETKTYEPIYYELDGKTTVTVAGDVKATATDGAATGINADGSGKTEVKGVQNVEVTGTAGATGITANSTGFYSESKYDPETQSYEYTYHDLDGKATVTASGDVTVKNDYGNTGGINASGSGDTSVTVSGKLQVNSIGGEIEYSGPGGSSYTQIGNDYGVRASSGYKNGTTSVNVNGNVDVISTGNNVAGFENYGPGGSAGYVDAKIGGSLTVTTVEGTAKAVSASTNGFETISVGGDVIVSGADASGIYAAARGYESTGGGPGSKTEYKKTDGTITVNAKENLIVTATDGNASGINANGTGTTEVKVGGDATITGPAATGIHSNVDGEYVTYSYDSETQTSTRISIDTTGKATTEVGGDLTVKGQDRADGIEIFGSGDNTVIIGKKLTTTSDGYAATDDYGDGETYSNNLSERAVGISLDEGGSATVTIGEGVEATSTLNDVTGVSIDADDEEKVSVTIEDGGLTLATGEEADATAVNIFNAGGHVGVDINGDVVSTGGGINIRSDMQSRWKTLDFEPKESELIRESEDGEYKEYYSADKNVYYDSDGNVWSYVNKGATSVHVVGDVTVNGKDSSAIYISATDNTRYVYDEEGYTGEVKEDELVYWTKRKDADGNIITNKTYYNAEGDFYYDNNGHKWSKEVQDANESETEVLIEGDVTAADTAIMIDAPSETAAVDVIVDGTVAGEEHSIVLTNSTTSEKMMITVWEVKANEQGHLIERIKGHDYTGEEGITIYEQDRDAEQEIQYIIRIAQPEYISTAGTTNYNGYEVAREGDIVYVYLNIPSGYEVNQVYMDDGQTVPVLKDAAGNYYLAVPWGGGVLLSLKMRRRQANLTPAVITLDPNGGTIDGSSEPIQIKTYINKQYVLPEAPEREGATFLGWFESPYGKEDEQWKAPEAGSELLLEPGTRVKIKEKTVYFTAIWAEKSPD